VEPGLLYRSGQMTSAGFVRTLEENRIRTVISFRDAKPGQAVSPDEFEVELCNARGVQHHRLGPLRWSTPDGTIPAEANVEKFLQIVKDPKTPRPILVHCFAGVHRTGIYVALYRVECQGWSPAEAMREMLEIADDKPGFEADVLHYLANYQPKPR
jgi:tyrosine-protein phosphatase SIW14